MMRDLKERDRERERVRKREIIDEIFERER